MGREVRRARKGFEAPLRRTWWGYRLPSIPCHSCIDGHNSAGDYCTVCEGEQVVFPKVEPPAYPVHEFPFSIVDHMYGWQMWETTSEGSPISPVCDSPEELARWLADNSASAFGERTATYDEWLAMIHRHYAPSGVFTGGELVSGVEAIGELYPDEE